jgi:hypothetical protein
MRHDKAKIRNSNLIDHSQDDQGQGVSYMEGQISVAYEAPNTLNMLLQCMS